MHGYGDDVDLAEAHGTPGDRSLVLEQLLGERWSCRAFEDRKVPRPVIERLLTLAQRSASWCNTQPWQVIVTTGGGTERFRSALSAHVREREQDVTPDFGHPDEYHGVYRQRRRTTGWQLYEAVGVQRGDRAASAEQAFQNYRLFGAPHVAIITTDGSRASTVRSTRAPILARSCSPPAASASPPSPRPRWRCTRLSSAIISRSPRDRKILAGISFGYPDLDHPANGYRTDRAPLAEIVTWTEA